MKRGKFVTFEGDDGSGKTTQIRLLEQYLISKGLDVLVTKEPGSHLSACEAIRNILLNPECEGQLTPVAELLLFEADRSIHTKNLIIPALKQGKIVLSDRFYDSTTAYQGVAGKIGLEIVLLLNKIASFGLNPDITFYLDATPHEGIVETKEFGVLDRLESKLTSERLRRVDGFRALALLEPERVKPIRYLPNKIEEMQKQIRSYVDKIL